MENQINNYNNNNTNDNNINIKKIYKHSRIITSILVFLILNILIISLNPSLFFIEFIFLFITWVILLTTQKLIKKAITYGDKIENKFLKFIFYFILLNISIALSLLTLAIITNSIDYLVHIIFQSEIMPTSILLLEMFLYLFIPITFLAPYFNTLIFLLLRRSYKI